MGQDKAVRDLLTKMKSERKAQQKADRERYGGLFNRGAVVTNDPRLEGDQVDPANLDLNDPKVQAMLDIYPGPQGAIKPKDQPAGSVQQVSQERKPAKVEQRCKPKQYVKEEEEDDDKDEGGGLINLDMKQFGTGTMEDPLKHAVVMRSAQDDKKMVVWKSWPSLFQNTIFHGEQDPEIKEMRRAGTSDRRVARANELKEEGTALLKA